ncbi:zinc finger protein 2 isoform X2 [Drosophila busckii]|uniref:zinc finger protein 2 isoform X2 n=1 Tax=Drosophila busckii TaxID=30019 RepID=UPI00083EBA59|nr:zinc finger protein 2 isoform X2 [Drosophila busckii]
MNHLIELKPHNANDGSPMSNSDVETFNGKIVYSIDGSALIIDAGDTNIKLSSSGDTSAAPSTYIPPSVAALKATLRSTGSEKAKSNKYLESQKLSTAEEEAETSDSLSLSSVLSISRTGDRKLTPKIHSFRVVSAEDAAAGTHCQDSVNAFHTQNHKPILMCFICKLSFGNANSFSLHANTEHRLNLQELEQQLLSREYSSAIIQRNMDEKPQISFLQPLDAGGTAIESGESLHLTELSAVGSNEMDGSNPTHTSVKPCSGNGTNKQSESKHFDNVAFIAGSEGVLPSPSDSSCTTAISPLEVAVKSTVKSGSLNSVTAKTNIPQFEPSILKNSTTATEHSHLPPALSTDVCKVNTAIREVCLPPDGLEANSTDNISSNKSSATRNTASPICLSATQETIPTIPVSRFGEVSGSPPPESPQPSVDLDPAPSASELLQQHLLSLQQQVATSTGVVFPPMQSQAQTQISSFHASLTALANEQNARGVKLLTEFLQQQLQQQQQQILFSNSCAEHQEGKGVDCKACEVIDIQDQIKSPTLQQQSQPYSQSQSQAQTQLQTQAQILLHSQPRSPNNTNGSSGGVSTSISMPISPSTSSVASVGNPPASSFTIGACSEHINGRPQGVDCTRCEMLLNSARLNSGVQMSTRNSCKTLKCPQCNWHYKYQETLEIHMREKHPDGESACGYCLAGQQHPRLARGESYSCGYKPYRCEICNYSTTTKGNLSIHMQSDKHLNNMQELNSSQNMVAAAKLLLPSPSSQGACIPTSSGSGSSSQPTVLGSPSVSTSISSNTNYASSTATSTVIVPTAIPGTGKSKPSFRCDICSYETSVARNLRIHMTSEKHTHNMAVLQNNIKHIQALNFLQQQQQGVGGNVNSFLAAPEAALADLAYNQALMIQLLQQNTTATQPGSIQQQPNTKLSSTASSPVSPTEQLQLHASFPFSPVLKSQTQGISHNLKVPHGLAMNLAWSETGETQDSHFQPTSLADAWPTALYSCQICDCFSTNNMDELNQHLQIDRTRQSSSASSTSSSDIMIIHNNNYICRLCNYKTNLKANFQLHSKTDKHLQKLNFINHIREGGTRNEYKLQFQSQLAAAGAVQLKCNCCDFHTNSIQKLSLHTQQMRHDTMRTIFQHLLYIVQQSSLRLVSNPSEPGQCQSEEESSLEKDQNQQQKTQSPSKSLCCHLCNFVAKSLLEMVQHVKGFRHMQVEQFVCLQRRSENLEMPGLNEVFKVTERLPASDEDEMIDTGLNLTECTTSASEPGFGPSRTTPADINTFSPASISSHSTSYGKMQARSSSPSLNPDDLSLGASIKLFKCNICEYFVQTKKDIEAHMEAIHPTSESDDYISIPTNEVAFQAFQTAVAAAALAAAQRCNVDRSPTLTPMTTPSHATESDAVDDCPIEIKRERLEGIDETIDDNVDSGDILKVNTQSHTVNSLRPHISDSVAKLCLACPLCLESGFSSKHFLETHLVSVHSVTRDGLARLLHLVDPKPMRSSISRVTSSLEIAKEQDGICVRPTADDTISTAPVLSVSCSPNNNINTNTGIQGLSCQQCESTFKHEEQLLQHAQQTQHFPIQNGEYQCLALTHISRPCPMTFSTLSTMVNHFKDSHMCLVISERHVYKYRCKQCSLAFKTQEKLTTHMLYHTMRDATKCSLCQRNFRSTQALQKHMEQTHATEFAAPTTTASGNAHADIVPEDSPRELSPSLSSNEMDKSKNETNLFDFVTHASEYAEKNNEMGAQSPRKSQTPVPISSQPKESNQNSIFLSPNALNAPLTEAQQQQQHLAALTAALLKYQQDNMGSNSPGDSRLSISPNDVHKMHNPFASLNPQSFQGLQNLHQIQQQITTAAVSSGIPMNPVDMINLMQFHHLMSLNFMNLAPPLIFGGNTTNTNSSSPIGGVQNNGVSAVSPSQARSQPHSSMAINTASLSDLQQQPSMTSDCSITNPQNVVSSGVQQQLISNQKRARTRITDDQLKILRAHFDINNSPSEESIMDMSQKANLPMKVVKHWFRNTLFKERQRNKDSPYNFNNPPSTTLNLEEYERTGHAKVTPLSDSSASSAISAPPSTIVATDATTASSASPSQTTKSSSVTVHTFGTARRTSSRASSANSTGNILEYSTRNIMMADSKTDQEKLAGLPLSSLDMQIKTEPQDEHPLVNELQIKRQYQFQQDSNFCKQQQISEVVESQQSHQVQSDPQADYLQDQPLPTPVSMQSLQSNQVTCFETKSESGSSDVLSRPATPNSLAGCSLYSNMNDILNQQLENMGSNMGPPKKQTAVSKSIEKGTGTGGIVAVPGIPAAACAQFENTSSNSSNSSSSTSGGKRANRTRFTDYQIKVLQEFFENNSYPKDSDLEYLSKLLLLSPRVIVVWFQNARQKQRKIYENQPNNSLYENEEAKKQNINYACKKCSLVFQRYYELIRHQKNHCFKEENNKKSAKAQIAAAQIAQNLSSEDSNSSMDIHHHHPSGVTGSGLNVAAAVAAAAAAAAQSGVGTQQQFNASLSPQHLFSKSSSLTDFSPSTTPTPPQRERSNSLDQQRMSKFDCDKCELQFNHLEHLRDHQLMHLMNPTLYGGCSTNQSNNQSEAAAYGPFGSILQSLQQAAQQQQQQQQQKSLPSASKKRKLSGCSSNAEETISSKDIDANQKYDFLYHYYMQHETSAELRQQFQIHHQQRLQGNDTDFDIDFLSNFYQQSEMKKVSSYDFLIQYYRKNNKQHLHQLEDNRQHSFNSSTQPSIDFLLQFYQLNESKKFFQLVASPQTVPDGSGSQPSSQRPSATTDENYSVIGEQMHPHNNLNNIFDCNGQVSKNDVNVSTNAKTGQVIDVKKGSSVDKTLKNGASGRSDLPESDNLVKLNNNSINITDTLSEEQNFELINVSQHENVNEDLNETQNHIQVDNVIYEEESDDLKEIIHGRSRERERKTSSSDADKTQYFQNLEDFLDATMIENNSQMLTFNDDDIHTSARVDNVDAATATSKDFIGDKSDTASAQLSAPSKQNKRLRTTILPEQLNFLYECYQTESNPSRKMLEEISKKVNLKKRVVQVWFQNSRAKDKKSRNQRQYAHISDDNNSYDGSCGKEANNTTSVNGLKGKHILSSTELKKSTPASIPSITPTPSVIKAELDVCLQDCQLCQVPQVNMQKHAFSVEHICKMRELLEQTSELYANASGSDENDSDKEKRNYSLSRTFLMQNVATGIAPTSFASENDRVAVETCLNLNIDAADSSTNDADIEPDRQSDASIPFSSTSRQSRAPESRCPMAGDMTLSSVNGTDLSSNGDGGPERNKNISNSISSRDRDIMKQLFSRSHITVIGGN